jgi:predicted Zn-dependent protease
MKRFTVIPVMVVILSSLAAGCATAPVTGRTQLLLVPEGRLTSYSDEKYDELLSKAELAADPGQVDMVNNVGRRVTKAAENFLRSRGLGDEVPQYNWEYALIKDDDKVNAFCMAGGKIGVYTGMLSVAGNEAGLAAVMSHEVAHALAQHNRERVSHLLVAQLGGIALSEAIDDQSAKTQEIVLTAYGLGSRVGYILPYSRVQEEEADRIGLIVMAMAGYDPREAVDLWHRMKKVKERRPPEFLSTHPAPDPRIEKMRSDLPAAMEYYNR